MLANPGESLMEQDCLFRLCGSDMAKANLSVLKELFPEVYRNVEQALTTDKSEKYLTQTQTTETADGPVVYFRDVCQDHATKPIAAAKRWANQIASAKNGQVRLCVVGFGAGYHVEALMHASKGLKISVIEPSIEVFTRAILSRDLRRCISELCSLKIGQVDDQSLLDEDDLVLRPQCQAASPAECLSIRSAILGKRGLSTLKPSFAVLGPVQGGTLPIASYTLRAFGLLGQRVKDWNMSDFAAGYQNLDRFLKQPVRLASLQRQYVEMMSNMLLEAAEEKPIDVLVCMAQAPISQDALTKLRRRGVITVLWFMEDYLRFTYWKEMARYYDYVFTIQKGSCIEAIKKAGAGEVHYLPVACDPQIHVPLDLSPEEQAVWGSPISFVGAGYYNRQQTFSFMAEMPLKLWGTEWPMTKPFDRLVQEKGRRLSPQEYVKIFNSTAVNLNLHSSTERSGVDPSGDFVNPRTFELAACGAFQLVDQRRLLPELFEPEKEIVTFSDINELKDKVNYYINRPEERQIIAQRGRKRALKDHSYQSRIESMLSIIYSSRYDNIRLRYEESPWNKMLRRARRHEELYQRCKKAFIAGEEANLDGLVWDIVAGQGDLSETEQKLLFLQHVRNLIIHVNKEERGG